MFRVINFVTIIIFLSLSGVSLAKPLVLAQATYGGPNDPYQRLLKEYDFKDAYISQQEKKKNQKFIDETIPQQYRGAMPVRADQSLVYRKSRNYAEIGFRNVKLAGTKLEDPNKNATDPTKNNFFDSDDIEYGNGYGVALKMGIDKPNDNRFDLEFDYEVNSANKWNFKNSTISDKKFDSSKISVFSFNLNYYRDFFSDKIISPYVGVGAGVSSIKFDIGEEFNKNNQIIGSKGDLVGNYQAILGARVNINARHAINLSYRYRSTFSEFEVPVSAAVNSGGAPATTPATPKPLTAKYSAQIGEISYQYLF